LVEFISNYEIIPIIIRNYRKNNIVYICVYTNVRRRLVYYINYITVDYHWKSCAYCNSSIDIVGDIIYNAYAEGEKCGKNVIELDT
jgi:hypothetical protein